MLMASILSYYDKEMGIGILFISVGFTVNTVFIAVFNHAPISKDIQCFDTNETNNMAEKKPRNVIIYYCSITIWVTCISDCIRLYISSGSMQHEVSNWTMVCLPVTSSSYQD